MGFYGNITNTVKTNLQFDKKYCNRFELESKCAGDGVLSGRYVLVEYDLSWNSDGSTNDAFEIIYTRIANGVEQFSSAPDFSTAVTPWPDVIYRAVEVQPLSPLLSVYTNKYYIGVLHDENKYDTVMEKQKTALANLADLKNRFTVGLISEEAYNTQKTEIYTNHNNVLRDAGGTYLKLTSNSESNYVTNFNIDTNYYGDGRGWDSTVWMKSYDTQGTPKYVMVAELNSIVPTFAISVDAPTEIPQSPHFDATNTNIFYTMHLQPQWGFQVKAAEGSSDFSEDRTFYTYDTENNIIGSSQRNQPLNIYYNKAGFKSDKKHYIPDATDRIAWEATGKSGKYYNNPNHQPGAPVVGNQVDMYEFSMLLPSLGNAVSEMWDAVYDVNESNIRKRDVAWKDAFSRTTEDSTLGGMSSTLNTLAGTINAAHKLMGMIITDKSPSYLNETGYNNNFIYEDSNSYYRIVKNPIMTLANTIDNSMKYYVKNVDGSYKPANPNVNERDYYYISGYNYKYVELLDFYDSLSTMHGLLLKMAQMLDLNNEDSVDTTTVQGCINQLNSIIDVFGELIPGQFIIVNSSGEIVSSSWTTEQTFTYKNEMTDAENEESPEENCWITVNVDPAEKLITILHNLARSVEGESITTDFDTDDYASTSAEFSLYTPIVDGAGHIVGKNNETIVLPKSFKSFDTNCLNDSVLDLSVEKGKKTYVANTIKDNFSINVGNAWVKSSLSDNVLTFGHAVNEIPVETNETDLNAKILEDGTAIADTGSFSTLTQMDFDEAGHISYKENHTYHLPHSFKYINTTGNANLVVKDLKTISQNTDEEGNTETIYTPPQAGSLQALSVGSSLNINPANKWIQTSLIQEESTNILNIAHNVFEKINIVPGEVVLNNNKKDFTSSAIKCDEAGHVYEINTTTWTLPNNFSSFALSAGSPITPTSLADTLYFSANEWLALNYTQTEDNTQTLEFAHAVPVNNANNKSINSSATNSLSPAFGGTFKVPAFTYDEKGHIYSADSYDITLPLIDTKDSDEGNVLIASAIDATNKGQLNFTRANIGSLAITGYSAGENSILSATDSLNSALSALESGYLSNQAALDTLMGSDNGSVSKTVSDAISAITGGNTTTIQALNDALSNKLDSDKNYTITSTDRTVTLAGNLESILKQLLDRTISASTETT